MNTQKLYDLKEMLCHELEEVADKGSLSSGDLSSVKMLTSSMDHICNIMDREQDGYSNAGNWRADMRGTYGNSYRRDSMGRYSGDGGSYDSSNRGYSRDGYSREGYNHNDDVRGNLKRMMDDANSEKEREAIRRCIESMR